MVEVLVVGGGTVVSACRCASLVFEHYGSILLYHLVTGSPTRRRRNIGRTIQNREVIAGVIMCMNIAIDLREQNGER